AIYSGPSLDSLALAGCNDDFSSLQSRVQFTANADTTYSIQAGGFLGAAGDLQLTIGVAAPTPTPTDTPTATPTKQPPPGDTDGDGCTDQEENGPNEALGGRRSFLNPWDLYDVNGDGTVDLFVDVFGVAGAFGQGPGGPDYSTGKDRSPPPSEAEEPDPDKREPWDMGPPDTMIDLFVDIFGVALQFGHDCS
ncbi:MAG: flexitail domain-containing putative surface protein, partial [Dehalococcoidia bacterium]|nr:flexitail domain-containing putative surface protein [Dehalococcoidia bacterium]